MLIEVFLARSLIAKSTETCFKLFEVKNNDIRKTRKVIMSFWCVSRLLW